MLRRPSASARSRPRRNCARSRRSRCSPGRRPAGARDTGSERSSPCAGCAHRAIRAGGGPVPGRIERQRWSLGEWGMGNRNRRCTWLRTAHRRFPIPHSRFQTPHFRFPIPDSRFPTPRPPPTPQTTTASRGTSRAPAVSVWAGARSTRARSQFAHRGRGGADAGQQHARRAADDFPVAADGRPVLARAPARRPPSRCWRRPSRRRRLRSQHPLGARQHIALALEGLAQSARDRLEAGLDHVVRVVARPSGAGWRPACRTASGRSAAPVRSAVRRLARAGSGRRTPARRGRTGPAPPAPGFRPSAA
jgi:hypothetical protein